MSVQPQDVVTLDVALSAVNDVLAKKRSEMRATAETRLDELGFSSLDVAEVMVTIEELVGCELDPESGQDLVVVADLARLQPL